MRWFPLVCLVAATQAQDFMSLIAPFLGSGLGGGGGGGGGGAGGGPGGAFGSILSAFSNSGGGAGANNPFGDLFKMGAGMLNKPPRPAPVAAWRPPKPPARGGGGGGGAGIPDISDYDQPLPKAKAARQNRRKQQQQQELARRRRQQQKRAQRQRQAQRNRRPQPGGQKRWQTTTETPEALAPPGGMEWIHKKERMTAIVDPDYEDSIDLALTGARHQAAPPPPPQQFTPVGRSVEQQPNRAYYRPQAKTFVRNDATGPPPVRPFVSSPIKPFKNHFDELFKVPVTQLTTPLPGPTLPPPEVPKSDPKLLAHNAARMIREIATFSDVHTGQNEDYSSVQTLMEAFFTAVSGPAKGGVSGDFAANPLPPQFDGTEMGANRPLTNKLFESDMVLTVEQMKGVVLASKQIRGGRFGRQKRKVITGAVYRWPKAPIPYRFKDGDEKWKNLIRSALAHWQSETCVRWKENGMGKDHVVFFRGSGCYSSVGRTGGSQLISIGYGCEDKGIVTHEVGHSLGFWHEQSRPDRDRYIHLNKDYIIRGTLGNFELRTTEEIEDMGLPYDLGSVMHYGPTAFTKDWDENTIKTLDKNYQRTIGQRAQPSFIDVKQVNRLYCHDTCPAVGGVKCENGGYPDPNHCNQCKCPPGLGGTRCDQVQQSETTCGGELIANPLWQELGHRGKKKCYWRIKTNNARIKVILSNVTYRCETTCKAYVEIKHNSDFQQTGFRTCCPGGEIEVTSEQSELLIMTDSSILDYETGFNLRYIQDSGQPLPRPPPPAWVPGQENRGFRGATGGGISGPVEKFILNAIPKIRDANRPLESIASIVTEYSIASLLGIRNN